MAITLVAPVQADESPVAGELIQSAKRRRRTFTVLIITSSVTVHLIRAVGASGESITTVFSLNAAASSKLCSGTIATYIKGSSICSEQAAQLDSD